MEIIYKRIGELIHYANNAKQHPPEQVRNIAESIRRFGFQQPVLIDLNGVIVAGHGRVLGAAEAGLAEVPCIYADGMSDEDVRAYRIMDNKLNESPWNTAALKLELPTVDLSGFDLPEVKPIPELTARNADENSGHFWGDEMPKETEEYKTFLDKFVPKATTDDCYTPLNIYNAVRGWAVKRFELGDTEIVRPFYPGGDYERSEYP